MSKKSYSYIFIWWLNGRFLNQKCSQCIVGKNIAKQEYIARITDNVFGKNCIIYVLVKKLKITATIAIK